MSNNQTKNQAATGMSIDTEAFRKLIQTLGPTLRHLGSEYAEIVAHIDAHTADLRAQVASERAAKEFEQRHAVESEQALAKEHAENNTLRAQLARQGQGEADEARRHAFAEIGEKLRANIRSDELARFVDAEILKPRAQPDRGAAQGDTVIDYGNAVDKSAPHSQPVRGVPDGFVLVPVEPTEAMIHAAEDLPAPRMFGKVYRAMLAAAPSPAAQPAPYAQALNTNELDVQKTEKVEHKVAAAQPVAPLAPVSLQREQVGGQSDDDQELARRVIDQTIEQGFVSWPYDEKYRAAMGELLQPYSTASEGADKQKGDSE